MLFKASDLKQNKKNEANNGNKVQKRQTLNTYSRRLYVVEENMFPFLQLSIYVNNSASNETQSHSYFPLCRVILIETVTLSSVKKCAMQFL